MAGGRAGVGREVEQKYYVLGRAIVLRGRQQLKRVR